MDKLLEYIYERYNDLELRGYYIWNNKTALRILKEGWNGNVAELEMKIHEYDSIEKKEEYQELVSIFSIEQPTSIVLRIQYLEIVLDSLPEGFFQDLKITKKKILQITLSIMIYYLFLQTHKVIHKNLSKSERKWMIGKEDFYIGLNELKLVCWEIESEDFKTFVDVFAFDIEEQPIDNVGIKKLYQIKDEVFILSIQEFLDYVLFEIEDIFKKEYEEERYSLYQKKKGDHFEILAYVFLKSFYSDVAHSIFYYPQINKKSEIDLLVKKNNTLLIIECKSGTIELRTASTDEQIRVKIDNKVKKAYKTLENANTYIRTNEFYKFSNREKIIEGKSRDTEVLCLHLSMYPMDSISSNIHSLNEKYIGKSNNPKITMSFEHFVAIYIDCMKRQISFEEYLLERKKLILKYPRARFDVNELDLYFQLTNKIQKSMLTESLEEGMFDNFKEDVRITTVFHHESGNEYRPATEMLKVIDTILLENLFQEGKRRYGLNKKFMKHFKNYITVNSEES